MGYLSPKEISFGKNDWIIREFKFPDSLTWKPAFIFALSEDLVVLDDRKYITIPRSRFDYYNPFVLTKKIPLANTSFTCLEVVPPENYLEKINPEIRQSVISYPNKLFISYFPFTIKKDYSFQKTKQLFDIFLNLTGEVKT